MGERGPTPKPPALKILGGTDRPDRRRSVPPGPREGWPSLPPGRSERYRAIWRQLKSAQLPVGNVTKAEWALVQMLVATLDRLFYATELLDESGPLIRAGGTGARRGELVKNPLHQVVRDDTTLAVALMTKLQMSPADRARQLVPAGEERDPFAEFLEEERA